MTAQGPRSSAAGLSSTGTKKIGQSGGHTQSWEEIYGTIGQCHCGSLRVMATGEPDRVYLCHCKACQRRTGTSFHFGASYPKERVRLDGERKIYERDADSGYRAFGFISARLAAALFFGKGTAILRSVESLWARLTHRPFRCPATRSGRSRCIRGSACRWGWTTTGKPDHRLHERKNGRAPVNQRHCVAFLTWELPSFTGSIRRRTPIHKPGSAPGEQPTPAGFFDVLEFNDL